MFPRSPLITATNNASTLLLLAAIAGGSWLGLCLPAQAGGLGEWVDPLILALVVALLSEVDFLQLRRMGQGWRCLALTWGCNFLVIPVVGWCIAHLLVGGHPECLAGLLLYFLAPCTDWFLGFTRLAGGNTALGAVLLPVNLLTQLLLYPLFLQIAVGRMAGGDMAVGSTLLQWFMLPLLLAVVARVVLKQLLSARQVDSVGRSMAWLVPCILAVLVACIFATHVQVMLDHVETFGLILLAVFVFYWVAYAVTQALARAARLSHADKVLLAMSTSARNAPLMLGLTMACLPDQPVVYAALIVGMLIEFPHLTVMKHLLIRGRGEEEGVATG